MNFKSLIFLILFGAISFGCAKEQIVNQKVSPELRWMDRTVYFAYSNGSLSNRNNEIQKQKVKEALKEIEKITSLGEGYFSFQEEDESLLTPTLTPTVSPDDFRSFILIWPDQEFSDFVVNQIGGGVPDPNALTILNSAYKRKFFMIFKASCFESSVACGGITSGTGLRALVARQIGLMTGLTTKDCDIYPNDVMCATNPNNQQWLPENRDQWAAAENNVLEAILTNQNFYKEFVPSSD